MKKVTNISIGGVVFTVEEDAYTILSKYLDTIREHYKKEDEQGEIVKDIEFSIAEKLGKTVTEDKKVIQEDDISAIIGEMGTIEDFEMSEGDGENIQEQKDGSEKLRKKLYRNVDDQIISGVSSGIASYFGIDPVFVRLLFVLSIFAGGFGIVMYLVLWIVMPPAETASQKLGMQGDPVTLQELEKLIKDKIAASKKERSLFKRALQLPFVVLKGVIQFLRRLILRTGSVLRALVGVFLVVIGGAGAMASIISVTVIHFSINSGLSELPVREFLTGAEYWFALSAFFLLTIIPSVIAVLLGVSILQKARKFLGVIIGVLVLIWMGALFGAGHTASVGIPHYKAYVESIPTVTEVHELENFDEVNVSSGDNVLIQYGEVHSISLSGKEVGVRNKVFEVQNGVLVIRNSNDWFNPTLDIIITTPRLEAIEVSRSTNIAVDEFVTKRFTAVIDNHSRVDLKVATERLKLTVTNNSKVYVSGSATELEAVVKYRSEVDAIDLVNVKTLVEAVSSSKVEVGVTEVLNATALYNSEIVYDGDPEITKNVQRSSKIEKRF